MPRTLKRRAEAISRDEDSDPEDILPERPPPRPTQAQSPRHRLQSTPASNVSGSDVEHANISDNEGGDSQTLAGNMIKKLVRLALASEYARQPLRRADINAKILKSDGGSASIRGNFRLVFNGAQKTLRNVFGMELVDLPTRERTSLNDRRTAASQKATQTATQKSKAQKELDGDDVDTQGRSRPKDSILSATSWMLVSRLPTAYKTRQELLIPSRAPDSNTEAVYTALCTMIVTILYIHTPSGSSDKDSQAQALEDITEPISDTRLLRFLSRLGLREWAPMGTENGENIDKVLARMMREGYIDKRRDNSTGEEIVEWVVGPRGKREIGRKGVAAFVRGVYGFGIDGTGQGLELPPQPGEEEDGEAQGTQRQRPVKMERDELERRLIRTLGTAVATNNEDHQANGVLGSNELPERPESSRTRENQAVDSTRSTRRSTRRRGNDNEDDDDDANAR